MSVQGITDVRSIRLQPAIKPLCNRCGHRIGAFTLLSGHLVVTCTNRISRLQRNCGQQFLLVALPATRQVRIIELSKDEARAMREDSIWTLGQWLRQLGVGA